MGSIPVDGLIKQFQTMYHEHWSYEWGVAKAGCVDCSGAFVYAYQQYGKRIAHGSNSIARVYVEKILPINECKPGMAVFKYYAPGDPKWDLPVKYGNDGKSYNGDLNDYYHIGLADSDPRYILNAQSTKTGFVRSSIKSWNACGYLKAVDYGRKATENMEKMVVYAANGKPVRVRSAPGQTAPIIEYLKVGTSVMADNDVNGWRHIRFGQDDGYMMSEFLKADDPATNTDIGPAYIKTLTTEEYNEVCACRDAAKDIYDKLKAIVGVG